MAGSSFGGGLALSGYIVGTVAQLPSASQALLGHRAFVTDSNQTIALGLGTTVVGGGANKVPVYCDGSNWIIGG